METGKLIKTIDGTQNLIDTNSELINSYLSVMDIMKDISNLNANLGNIGLDMDSVYNGLNGNSNSNSVSYGNITVQVQGSTNMNEQQMQSAIEKALINVSNGLKF